MTTSNTGTWATSSGASAPDEDQDRRTDLSVKCQEIRLLTKALRRCPTSSTARRPSRSTASAIVDLITNEAVARPSSRAAA